MNLHPGQPPTSRRTRQSAEGAGRGHQAPTHVREKAEIGGRVRTGLWEGLARGRYSTFGSGKWEASHLVTDIHKVCLNYVTM